ncbi:MAG: DUF445 family protein [bacterium]
MSWAMIFQAVTIPIWGAFIGWITTYLAILMIFRPRNPVNVLGFKIQGIVPKKRHEIAMSIGRSVERDMISFEDFEDLIKQVNLEGEITNIIDHYIEERVAARSSDKSFIGRTYNLVLDNVRGQLKQYLAREISENANEIIKTFVDRLETDFDIQEIVARRINSYDVETLENVVFGFTKREFKFLEIMGGVFGYLIGIIQVVILMITRV